jgi:hypothetical protein
MAEQIVSACGPGQGNLPNAAITKRGIIHGQLFNKTANFNVIVSGNGDNCGDPAPAS